MRVLVGCEYSGVVRDALIRKGIDAVSCDIIDTESPGPHYKGDLFDILYDGWDAAILHPPCTYLCNSGVRWLAGNDARHRAMVEGAKFFKRCLDAPVERICVENPIMHKYAMGIIGVKYTQIIHPWMFGHSAKKATCLWLKGFKELVPTQVIPMPKVWTEEAKRQWNAIHLASPGPDRGKLRSKTFPGIADAFADQWF